MMSSKAFADNMSRAASLFLSSLPSSIAAFPLDSFKVDLEDRADEEVAGVKAGSLAEGAVLPQEPSRLARELNRNGLPSKEQAVFFFNQARARAGISLISHSASSDTQR